MDIRILAGRLQEIVSHLPPVAVDLIESGKPCAYESVIVQDARSMFWLLTRNSDRGAKLALRALQVAKGNSK